MSEHYTVPDLVPGAVHRAEEIIRGSRFIVHMAHTKGPEACKAFIESIRAEHAQATHNCWAYQAGEPGSTAHIGASDDGEPKGTAGRPMLTVLLHCGVGELSVVVTRYFGGTLLGTGGLVRAYQGMVKLGLETLPTKERRPCVRLAAAFEHRFASHVLRMIERAGATVLEKRFESNVVVTMEVTREAREALVKSLTEVTGGRIDVSEA